MLLKSEPLHQLREEILEVWPRRSRDSAKRQRRRGIALRWREIDLIGCFSIIDLLICSIERSIARICILILSILELYRNFGMGFRVWGGWQNGIAWGIDF